MRRSAGLLLVLFVSHLSMVAGGAVCVVPGMQPMAGVARSDALEQPGPMAGMAMLPVATAPSELAAIPASGPSSENTPCSGPASNSCAATMPCITALGADPDASIALPHTNDTRAQLLAVLMPASSGSAPDIPPPRA